MNSLLILFILLILSNQTHVSYILFILSIIHIVINIILLGNIYLALIYFFIYIGSIAILFIYILMVLSIISYNNNGYILFILPFITISIILLGLYYPINNNIVYNILDLSSNLYNILLLPISLILFITMVFAIRSI